MTAHHGADPALIIGIALLLGMVAQTLARHLRIPGIVLLLATGVLVGPDITAAIEPARLGGALQVLVGFAVAIILFEGGVSLNVAELRRQAKSIRRLVTLGALITTVGGALAARYILGWDWRMSILFGTLVIVTGPTVINPLMRRIKVRRNVSTILEAEGVFIDAVGAIVAVVALEIALQPPSPGGFLHGLGDLLMRFGIGGALGVLCGLVVVGVLKVEWLVPSGLENVMTLATVVFFFQFSNFLSHESGIVCVTVAGVAAGNLRSETVEDLRHFKEQLTVLFIGMLFVLLAADVRIDEVRNLGVPGLLTVAALMLVVRPIGIFASTWGADVTLREKLFLSWMAPRGIVAAAVSSLFAIRLQAQGFEDGNNLRALVFLVIAVTVLLQGLTGGLVARALRLKPPKPAGFTVLGANSIGLTLAESCRRLGKEVVFIDTNTDNCKAAQDRGFRVLWGSALDESVLRRARLQMREGCIGLTPNESVNYSFARRALREMGVARAWVALLRDRKKVSPEMVEKAKSHVLFGEPRNLAFWALKIDRGEVEIQRWRCERADAKQFVDAASVVGDRRTHLPLAIFGAKRGFRLIDETVVPEIGDILEVAVVKKNADQAAMELEALGWVDPALVGPALSAPSARS